MSSDTLWLVGCGAMAGAMLARWLATGLDPAVVTVIRPSGAPVAPGVRVLTALPAEAPPARLMLGFKPQQLADVAPTLQAAMTGATVLSLLAGVPVARLRALFPAAAQVIRVMPNLPVALGQGVVALYPPDPATAELMQPLGLVETLADEAQFDLVTALAGSGPAFTYRFVDALGSAAARLGLDSAQAERLALATVGGAVAFAQGSVDPPADLAERVASKGGSTRAGLDVLDADLPVLLEATLAAAAARNRELGGA